MITSFYRVTRNGDLRRLERAPKTLPYAILTTVRDNVDYQLTAHTLETVPATTPIFFACRCGYDRGPKLDARLRSALRSAQAVLDAPVLPWPDDGQGDPSLEPIA